MTSAVEICSNALLQLGDSSISSFDEENDRTTLVANLYDSKRDKVLRMNDWNCAIKRVVLSPDATAPEYEWAYRFLLPNDWLRTVFVGEADGDPDDYVPEGRYLLMGRDACYLRYVYRADESVWDSLLVEVMTEVMKAALTYPITKSTTKQATDEEIVKKMLIIARNVDAQDKPPETLGVSPLLARRGR